MPDRGAIPRRPGRRPGPTLHQRRRRAALAGIAALALIAGLAIGSCSGGGTLTKEQQLQAERASQPVSFTVSVSGDLLIHSPLWERALELGGGHYDFAPELKQLRPYVADADLGICHVE